VGVVEEEGVGGAGGTGGGTQEYVSRGISVKLCGLRLLKVGQAQFVNEDKNWVTFISKNKKNIS